MNNGHNIPGGGEGAARTVKLQHPQYVVGELASKIHETEFSPERILFVIGLKLFANNIMKPCQHSAFIKQTLLFRYTITTQVH